MRIVNIIGGLGNQMFQYAFAIFLQEKYPNEQIFIDTSHFNYLFIKKIRAANLHNGFELTKIFPNVSLPIASPKQLIKVTYYVPNYLLSRIVRKIFPKLKTEIIQPVNKYFAHDPSIYNQKKGDYYYEGIWESISNYIPIKEKLRFVFQHPTPNDVNANYISKIKGSNSVGIHVRRGDYLLSENFRGICDLAYYQEAISMLQKEGKNLSFYIFTNDHEWCEKKLKPLVSDNEFIIVKENKGQNSCWDMFLMTYCNNLIIANSSFSWWAAFLNIGKGKIIAPKKWVNRLADYDIWANDWIKI